MLNVLLKDSSAASSVDEVMSEATALKDEFDEELQVMIIFLCFLFFIYFYTKHFDGLTVYLV